MKALTLEDRVLYARLIVALADHDSFAIVEAYKAMGIKTKHDTPAVLEVWGVVETIVVALGVDVCVCVGVWVWVCVCVCVCVERYMAMEIKTKHDTPAVLEVCV